MSDCLFCNLQKVKGNILYENELVYVIADRFPCSNCHILVISKEHAVCMNELKADTMKEIAVTMQRIATHLGLKSYNICNNNEFLQQIKHVHFHVIAANETGNVLKNSDMSFSEEQYKQRVEELKKKFVGFS